MQKNIVQIRVHKRQIKSHKRRLIKFSIACAKQQSFIILNSCNFACKYKKITEILML